MFKNIIPKREESVLHEIKRPTENLNQAKKQAEAPFEHEEKIIALTKELDELDARLSGITEQYDVVIDPDEEKEPFVETAEEKSEREKIYDTDENDFQPVPDGSRLSEDDTPDIKRNIKR